MAKKYSISWENDEPVSFEVDGVKYDSLDDVPNDKDRDKLAAMMDTAEFDKSFEEFDKEFEKNISAVKEESKNAEKIILSVFSGVAVLMLSIAAIAAFFNVQKTLKEESADGIVVDVIQKREYINAEDRVIEDFYYPVVQFTAADGRRRTVQMTEGGNSPYYEKGNRVTVRYDPEHPLDARIKSLSSDMLPWILPGITGILGIAFGGAVMMVRKFLLPEAQQDL